MSIASAKTADPSMEEILASIRRIIADDQDGPTLPSPRSMRRQGGPAGQPTDEPDNDDSLDVGHSASELTAARPVSTPALEVVPADAAPDTREPEPQPKSSPEPVAIAAAEPMRVVEPTFVAPAPDPAAARVDTLVSRETNATVAHAFGLLSHTVLTQSSHTLEDLVREMLKPMLKVWLDDNLPPLVERLVRHEIERVARGGR